MNKPVEMISLPAAAILGDLSPLTLARALVAHLEGIAHLEGNGHAPRPHALPEIGAEYHGGIYAGLTLDAGTPAALLLLPGDADPLPWPDAVAWAEKQGGVLPSRIDQLVLFLNLKTHFQETWYWSAEHYAHSAAYAWIQSFNYGVQSYGHKDDDGRARAVRRLSNSAI